jgi:hypothetical protein
MTSIALLLILTKPNAQATKLLLLLLLLLPALDKVKDATAAV